MELIWDHTFGKQEHQDLVICRPMARPDHPDEEDEMLMFNKIVRGEFTFPSDPWDNISNEAKELICGLLTVNPYRRVNPQQALESSWISMHSRALQGGLGT